MPQCPQSRAAAHRETRVLVRIQECHFYSKHSVALGESRSDSAGVKKRWGHGQEDIFPVAQFEKLWSDLTALPDLECGYIVVPRVRGQQLKEPAQLDSWLRDGSAAAVDALCKWS